jgi:hypothetical protein
MNGYLIRPQSQTVSGESNIPLYDAKGNLERQGRITHPGAAKIILLDAAVTPNRIILGAATAYTDETTVSFVAKTDRDGEEVDTVELGDFWPMRICRWKENEVWVYGRDLREDEPGKKSHTRCFADTFSGKDWFVECFLATPSRCSQVAARQAPAHTEPTSTARKIACASTLRGPMST